MAYATISDVQGRMLRTLSADEQSICSQLLEDAEVIINAFAPSAAADVKRTVSCNMVRRALGDGETTGIPVGANQGTQTALGYSQTWTYATGGGNGELYLSKLEKQMLGIGNKLGSYSPVEELVSEDSSGETT